MYRRVEESYKLNNNPDHFNRILYHINRIIWTFYLNNKCTYLFNCINVFGMYEQKTRFMSAIGNLYLACRVLLDIMLILRTHMICTSKHASSDITCQCLTFKQLCVCIEADTVLDFSDVACNKAHIQLHGRMVYTYVTYYVVHKMRAMLQTINSTC